MAVDYVHRLVIKPKQQSKGNKMSDLQNFEKELQQKCDELVSDPKTTNYLIAESKFGLIANKFLEKKFGTWGSYDADLYFNKHLKPIIDKYLKLIETAQNVVTAITEIDRLKAWRRREFK